MSDANESRTHFDAAAARWEDNPVRLELACAVAAGVVEAACPSAETEALDFGCGTGLLARLLCGKVGRVLAVDTSAGMIEQVRSRVEAEGVDNIEARLIREGEGLSPAAFDLVFSGMVMHHIDDVRTQLADFARWLRPGGVAAVADLETEPGSFHGAGAPTVHHQGFDPETLADWLARAGLEPFYNARVYTVAKPSADDGGMRDYPVFLVAARKPA